MGVDACLYFRCENAAPEHVREWGWHICERFGRSRFFLNIGEFPLVQNDGVDDSEVANVYEVTFGTRYYGEGYERGDIGFIIAIAELLEHLAARARVPIEIRYGGDSTWDDSEVFDQARRQHLWRHFLEHGQMPYRQHDTRGPTKCLVCECGPINAMGGGPDYDIGQCDGCGSQFQRPRAGNDGWKVASLDERRAKFYGMGGRGTAINDTFERVEMLFKECPAEDLRPLLRKLGDELAGVTNVPPGVVDALKGA